MASGVWEGMFDGVLKNLFFVLTFINTIYRMHICMLLARQKMRGD